MKACISNKRSYATRDMAEDALLDAHIRSHFRTGEGPVAVYQCEDCGNFHLTSRGEMNPRLAKAIEAGSINKERTAYEWMNKLKRR